MAADLLYQIARDLLTVGEKILVTDGGRPAIKRKFVNIGAVLAPIEFGEDNSQLTVNCGPVAPDLITDTLQRRQGMVAAGQLPQVKFEVTILRPAALTGNDNQGLPDTDELDTAAKEHYADGWQLYRGLIWHWSKKRLVPSFEFDTENVQWRGLSQFGPGAHGGLSGWTVSFTLSVHDHYVEEAVSP